MNKSCFVARCVLALLAFSSTLAARQTNVESADCASYVCAPISKYKVVLQFRTELGPMLVLHITVNTKNVNREDLLALACALGRKYRNESALLVFILDTKKAAKEYNPSGEGVSTSTHLSLRADYGFLRDQINHSLRWRPNRSDLNTWIEIFLGDPPSKDPRPTQAHDIADSGQQPEYRALLLGSFRSPDRFVPSFPGSRF